MKISKKITLEIEVEIEGKFYEGSPGSFYRSNGDPGDPPEPSSFEINKVIWDGLDITKNLDQIDFDFYSLEEECINDIENQE